MFKPLGLTHSGWMLVDIDTTKHSKLCNRQGDTLTQVPRYGLFAYPYGGVRTSVAYLSEILLCMVNQGKRNGEQILKASVARELWHLNFTASAKPTNYDYDVGNYNEDVALVHERQHTKDWACGWNTGVNTYCTTTAN